MSNACPMDRRVWPVGLASLPPNIPIETLAQAAGVNIEMIADMGRAMQASDRIVRFVDEPTET